VTFLLPHLGHFSGFVTGDVLSLTNIRSAPSFTIYTSRIPDSICFLRPTPNQFSFPVFSRVIRYILLVSGITSHFLIGA
jgi:hypothetical protein